MRRLTPQTPCRLAVAACLPACLQAGESAAADMTEQMLANMEAAAREKDAADLKRRQESKLNDYTFTAGAWGTDAPERELDPKKVRGACLLLKGVG